MRKAALICLYDAGYFLLKQENKYGYGFGEFEEEAGETKIELDRIAELVSSLIGIPATQKAQDLRSGKSYVIGDYDATIRKHLLPAFDGHIAEIIAEESHGCLEIAVKCVWSDKTETTFPISYRGNYSVFWEIIPKDEIAF